MAKMPMKEAKHHAAKYRRADVAPGELRGARRDHQRKSPRMNANEVIITGRKRNRAPFGRCIKQRNAFFSLLLGEFHDQDPVFRGQADQHHHADLRVEIERQVPAMTMPMKEPRIPIVTDNSTGIGMVQLSYSATKNRYANKIAKPRMIAVFPSARFS